MERIKILIVEDDESTRNLYTMALSAKLFEKRFAAGGQEALEMYRDWAPDVILLDIMLPDLSGFQILKDIRREDAETPIIMATSLGSKDDVTDCAKLGIQGYIVKPFNYKELCFTIAKAL